MGPYVPDEKTFRELAKVDIPSERGERKSEGLKLGAYFAVGFLTLALLSHRKHAYKFLIPLGVGLSCFVFGPILGLLQSSIHNDGLTRPSGFTLQPYAELFTPGQARSAILHALLLAVIAVPVVVGLTGWIALELRKRPGFAWIFAMPSMIPAVAAAICWGWIFFPAGQAGLANLVVQAMGLRTRSWLLESDSATLALFSTLVWSMLGSSLVWLGALREVPANLIDAADLDGAEGWDRWRSTYWPSLRWAVCFIALGVLLACLQSFETTEIFRTNSATVGPDDILRLPGSHLFDAAFRDFNMGRAAAMGVAIGVIGLAAGIGVLWLAQGRTATRRGD
jgi:multiple sugar transport system permease protein